MATVITHVGEEWCVDFLRGSTSNKAERVGWGTGAGTAAKTDTDLFTTATEARVLATLSKTGSGSTAKYQAVATLQADGAKTITNVGLFDAAGSGSPPTGGLLVLKADHTGIGLALNDRIEYTITIDPS